MGRYSVSVVFNQAMNLDKRYNSTSIRRYYYSKKLSYLYFVKKRE